MNTRYITQGLIIALLSIIALAAMFFIYFIFGISLAFSDDPGALTGWATFTGIIMLLLILAGLYGGGLFIYGLFTSESKQQLEKAKSSSIISRLINFAFLGIIIMSFLAVVFMIFMIYGRMTESGQQTLETTKYPTISVPPTTKSPITTASSIQPLITKDPSNIVLNLDDLPAGFKVTNSSRKDSKDGSLYYVEFERGGNIEIFLRENPSFQGIVGIRNLVTKFDSIDTAIRAFDRDCAPNYIKVSSETLGDESITCKLSQGSADVGEFIVYFRKNNIISIVDAGGININKDDVVNLAKIVESKITSKTLSQPPITTLLPTTAPPTSAPPTPIKLSLKVGETAKGQKTEVTVISANKTKAFPYYSSMMNMFFTEVAGIGKILVLLDVEIRNIGSDTLFVSSYDFSLADSEGYKYDSQLYGGDDALSFMTLYPNQRVRGKVLFEIPETATGLKILYNFGDLFSGPKLASWSVE